MFKRAAFVSLAIALFGGAAFAQATRTWVSGTGDDANPCSRTAPCKTFAGAISKTAPAGEIDALDPAGYGAVTITKSITIDANNMGSVLVSGTNAIVVNTAATDTVIIRNLSINGLNTGLDGILIQQCGHAHRGTPEHFQFHSKRHRVDAERDEYWKAPREGHERRRSGVGWHQGKHARNRDAG